MRQKILMTFALLLAIAQGAWGAIAVDGKLPGAFSVSATKQVWFSQGNLQYQANSTGAASAPYTGVWRFATNQYEAIGSGNSNVSASYDGWIDSFGWGSGNQPTQTSEDPNVYSTFVDWGNHAISNGGNTANQWRTLSESEWTYLVSTRPNANSKRGRATINGMYCFVLLPDVWVLPSGLSFTPNANNWTNEYTTEQWIQMEDAGAVCFPAAGSRAGGTNNTNVNDYNRWCCYWSSTSANSSQGYNLWVTSDHVGTTDKGNYQMGASVRLVSETMFPGSGTEEVPYLISSEAAWNYLADQVSAGNTYSGKYFQLTEDIGTEQEPITRMIGIFSSTESDCRPFSGTFDGNGHTLTINYNTTSDYTAPFRYIQGATFKNLKVTGSITTTMNLAAGIAGLNTGATATFEQCVTDIIINSSSSTVVGWGRYDYHGGLLARTIHVDAMITDCVCGGSVNGSSSSNSNCASFVGVAENCTVYATRCLSTTSYTNVNKWNSLSHCAENAYRAVNVFYYVNANDAANVGEQVTTSQLADGTITTALQAGLATTVWVQYAAISQPMLRLFALNQANDGYYLIDSEQDWRNFASLIQTTPTANARMTADISVTTMVGSSDKPFSGIFNGDYHTLTVNISGSGEKTAPFCYVKEENGVTAVIRRLKVTGSISTADKFAGGIVGYSEGQVNIIGCGCSVTIHSTVNGDGSHGGLVGYSNGSLYIEGCTFTGKMLTTAGTYKCGGFIGWNGGATARMSSSLYAPAAIEGSETEVLNGPDGTISATFSRNGGTILNCYYTRTLGTAQGTQVYSITAGSDVTISGLSNASNTYPASGLTFYNPGLKCGDAYYARNGDAVGLNLSHADKAGYTFNQYTVTGGGSLGNPTTNTPTLTMTDANQTINATWTENTATLTDGDDLSALSAWAGKTCTVTYARSFTADKPSTVCLPFAYTKKTGDGSFYAFSGIEKVGSEYIATMTEPGTSTLTPNTPYLYKAATTGDADFSGTYAIPASITAGTTTSGDWTFKGTYETIQWTTAPTGTYGFSAQNVDAQGISQGQFVKVGEYVRIKPMRAYLEYSGSTALAKANGMSATAATAAASNETLPETISVRLISASGEVTAIGTINTKTGEVTTDGWYTLDGKPLPGKPTKPGIYVNNGNKVVIK